MSHFNVFPSVHGHGAGFTPSHAPLSFSASHLQSLPNYRAHVAPSRPSAVAISANQPQYPHSQPATLSFSPNQLQSLPNYQAHVAPLQTPAPVAFRVVDYINTQTGHMIRQITPVPIVPVYVQQNTHVFAQQPPAQSNPAHLHSLVPSFAPISHAAISGYPQPMMQPQPQMMAPPSNISATAPRVSQPAESPATESSASPSSLSASPVYAAPTPSPSPTNTSARSTPASANATPASSPKNQTSITAEERSPAPQRTPTDLEAFCIANLAECAALAKIRKEAEAATPILPPCREYAWTNASLNAAFNVRENAQQERKVGN